MSTVRLIELVNLNFFMFFELFLKLRNFLQPTTASLEKNDIFLLIRLFLFERLANEFVNDFCYVYEMTCRPTLIVPLQVIKFLEMLLLTPLSK